MHDVSFLFSHFSLWLHSLELINSLDQVLTFSEGYPHWSNGETLKEHVVNITFGTRTLALQSPRPSKRNMCKIIGYELVTSYLSSSENEVNAVSYRFVVE